MKHIYEAETKHFLFHFFQIFTCILERYSNRQVKLGCQGPLYEIVWLPLFLITSFKNYVNL